MSALLPYLVNWLQEYGYPALWGLVFVGAAGIPLPITLLLLAAGAFAAGLSAAGSAASAFLAAGLRVKSLTSVTSSRVSSERWPRRRRYPFFAL